MPNRIIREGILTSDKVNELTPEAEVFYRRLLSKVCDHGTFDGRTSVIRASLYPLRLDSVTENDCEQWLALCCEAGLVVVYLNESKRYVQVLNTQWQARSAAKNPLPTDPASTCAQLQTSARLDVVVDVDVDVVVDESPADEPQDPARIESPARAAGPVELDTWLSALGDADAIPADDPVFGYATKAGIPPDFLELSWHRFCEDMRERGTRKKDWRAHYRNAVRNNWYRLWAINRQGEYFLTTEGEQARRVLA